MSICIISDHIIMLRQNFIIMLSILIKLSLNMKGGASAPKAPPLDPPLADEVEVAHRVTVIHSLTGHAVVQSYNCITV